MNYDTSHEGRAALLREAQVRAAIEKAREDDALLSGLHPAERIVEEVARA